jgi:hypothetical protein
MRATPLCQRGRFSLNEKGVWQFAGPRRQQLGRAAGKENAPVALPRIDSRLFSAVSAATCAAELATISGAASRTIGAKPSGLPKSRHKLPLAASLATKPPKGARLRCNSQPGSRLTLLA